jgi:hypothetical protein
MQRAAFPELQGRPRPPRHRRPARPNQPNRSDRILIGLKVATFVAAAGLLGVIILLFTAGTNDPVATQAPAIPKIVPSPGDDAPGTGPTTTPTQIAPPDLQNETAEIAGRPAITSTNRPPKPSRTTNPPRSTGFNFAVIGGHCSNPGSFSVTREHQPVLCMRRSPVDEPRWVPVF